MMHFLEQYMTQADDERYQCENEPRLPRFVSAMLGVLALCEDKDQPMSDCGAGCVHTSDLLFLIDSLKD